ncbi:ferredoxin [Streptomyces sp. NPDC002004]
MTVHIDKDTCIGSGMCTLTAPKVFTQDDDGFSELLPGRGGSGDPDPMIREAVRGCPVQALTLTED